MMKRVFVLISLVAAILVIGGNAFAHIPEPSLGPEWKLAFKAYDGTTGYVDTRSITYLPKSIVKVRWLLVPRGELRRKLVHLLKNILLSEGKDPNNTKRLWYYITLSKFNCKTHQDAGLKLIYYSFEKAVLAHHSFQHEEWDRIVPGSVGEKIEKYVCKEVPLSIPNPPLGPEWKLVARKSNGSTFYVDTSRITYLPKGVVKVRTLLVPRGELRRGLVNALKKVLPSEGKNPNNAERLWYHIQLDKLNCKTHQGVILESIDYSFGKAVLFSYSFPYEEWIRIFPGSLYEAVENYVCKKHK